MSDVIEDNDQEPRRLSRRGFFTAGAGVAAAGAVLAACGSSGSSASSSSSTSAGSSAASGSSTSSSSGAASGDAKIAMFAAGLETLAVNTYKAGLMAATAGSLGAVPPAVATFAMTAMAQHQAAADKLAAAGGGGTPVPPPDVQAKVDSAFAQVKDVAGLATLALDLELTASATYLDVLPKLQSAGAIELVGSILPIERQHAAILLFALGQYPVPETFADTKKSVAPK